MSEITSPLAQILVIDDETGMREGCRRALQHQGYAVDTAANIADARQLLASKRYDLVLLDVMMPDGSGIDLIGPMHERDPDTVCIVITGFATVELAVDAVKRGAYDFIAKPFTTDQLVVATNQGLERRRLSLQAKRLRQVEAEAAELSRAKQELERLDQAKSQLMLKVAHEMRAPVAAVQSYIDLMQEGYLAPAEYPPTLRRVHDRLQEVLDLVGDLLELARLKQARDRVEAAASPQAMADILREVCELFAEQAARKHLELRLDVRDQPTVTASRSHLKQLWTNLISNAIKYTPQGGWLAVSLRSDQHHLTGVVEDSGIGIAPGDLPNLFQEFFRSDQAKASGEIGTGLGLSIVKQIVDTYHGEIHVDSKLAQGTRFTFTLPLDSGTGPSSRDEPAESPAAA